MPELGTSGSAGGPGQGTAQAYPLTAHASNVSTVRNADPSQRRRWTESVQRPLLLIPSLLRRPSD
jgi:hypothetical protein